MVKKCEFCGKEFDANVYNQKYCNVECRNNAAVKFEGICGYCGSKFKSRSESQRFCSIKCFNHFNHEPEYKNCEYCGKKFKATINRTKFCSHECYGKNKKQLGSTTCEYCGKEYVLKSNKDNLRFCSRECYNEFKFKASIMKFTCEFCGKTFEKEGKKSFNYIDGKKVLPKYCSKECVDKDRIGKYSRENHAQWKGGICTINDLIRANLKYWKRDVIKASDYTCFVSGNKGGGLVAHHIKPFHIIRDEILNKLGLYKKACIGDCTEEQYKIIIETFDRIHTIDLGVTINKELHKKFHQVYGHKATYEDLLEFKRRYKNGEFSHEAS